MTVQVDMSEVQRWGGLLASEAQEIVARVIPAVEDQQGQVEARAKAAAPRGATGNLVGSVRRTGRGLIRRVKAGSARAYYAHFQEFGTKKMSAQPFLLKQADAGTHSEFEGRVQRAVDNGPIYR